MPRKVVRGKDRDGAGGRQLCQTEQLSVQTSQGLLGLEVTVLTSTHCGSHLKSPLNIGGDA